MALSRARMALIGVGVAAAAVFAFAGWRYGGQDRGDIRYIENGRASWYGPGFHGKKTASGTTFDQNAPTAAHQKLPLGSEATVTNLENGKSVNVEINDRGPYVKGRTLDLSKQAAKKLGLLHDGTAPVRIEATGEQLDPDADGRPGARADNRPNVPGAK